jgi:hypothetical protein
MKEKVRLKLLTGRVREFAAGQSVSLLPLNPGGFIRLETQVRLVITLSSGHKTNWQLDTNKWSQR